MRLLVDTNVFLNVAREERQFMQGSQDLLVKIAREEISGLASCAVLMEIKWALHEKGEMAKAEKAVSLVEEIVDIVPIDKEISNEAIDLKIARKLELLDSVHVATAKMHDCILVTRDENLRKKCEDLVAIRTPEELKTRN